MYLRVLLSTLISFLFIQQVKAQYPTLWGMSRLGGNGANGNIFKIKGNGTGFTNVHSFTGIDGNQPFGSLLQAKDGKLYGMTAAGGVQDAGVIFSIDTTGANYSKLFDFNQTDGYNPHGNLIQTSNGKLYGAAMYGGTGNCAGYNCGVIFCFDVSTNTYSKIVDFSGNDGHFPCGSLLQASDGNLYGMTQYGGANGFGNLFRINPINNVLSNLYSFSNHADPQGNLIQANDGKLYGMTVNSGSGSSCGGGCGTIFSYDISNNLYSKLYDFDTLGVAPVGSLVQANNGLLYGLTTGGGNSQYGVLFSFDIITYGYNKLHDFDEYTGQVPLGSLIQGSDGKLYGMTSAGCNGPTYGVLFSFDIGSSSYSVIHSCGVGEECSEPWGNDFIEVKANINAINTVGHEDFLLFYPNPSKGNFTIDTPLGDSFLLDLYDLEGRNVLRRNVGGMVSIDISNLDNGIYTLTLKNNSSVIKKKLMVAD